MKFEETSIPQSISVLESGKGFNVDANEVHYLVKTYIAGISDFCALVKTKAQPIAVMVQDLKGNFIFAAVVSYNDADDEDEAAAGNWNYVFTFNKEDIPENATVYQVSNEQVSDTIATRGFDLCRLTFTEAGFCPSLAIDVFNCVKNFLDQNAPSTEGEKFDIELDGYFEASVSIENGEKVFSIMPKGEMKSLVKKNDDANQK